METKQIYANQKIHKYPKDIWKPMRYMESHKYMKKSCVGTKNKRKPKRL